MIEGTLKYEFDPQEDITAYELASMMKLQLYTISGTVQSEIWTKLPEGLRRHFKITEVTYQNEGNEQGPTQSAQQASAGKAPLPAKNPGRTIPLGPGGAGGGSTASSDLGS